MVVEAEVEEAAPERLHASIVSPSKSESKLEPRQ